AKEMYHEMGDETAAFIDLMLENDAFDVEARKNKWGGPKNTGVNFIVYHSAVPWCYPQRNR
ncbi:MAG: hypothetical protein IKJ50_06340, partial [Clostridia bacterium]|nr:hypothetical protein [Clostridia bacterium]